MNADIFTWNFWDFSRQGISEYLYSSFATRDKKRPPLVTIFGAGITGLSAAHELAERGFQVQIVEPEADPFEEYHCKIGGMAANQLSRVSSSFADTIDNYIKQYFANINRFDTDNYSESQSIIINPYLTEEFLSFQNTRENKMLPIQERFLVNQRIIFNIDSDNANWINYIDYNNNSNKYKLGLILDQLRLAFHTYINDQEKLFRVIGEERSENWYLNTSILREILSVRVIGYTDGYGLPDSRKAISTEWAEMVCHELANMNEDLNDRYYIPHIKDILNAEGYGQSPIGDQSNAANRMRSNRVEFRIVEQVIPGEHGFRFFPGFYRHIFDTLKRTPILDFDGEESESTVFDQLIDTPKTSIGFNDDLGFLVPKLKKLTSLRDFSETLDYFKNHAGFSDLDLLRFQLRLIKFLTSGDSRRRIEAENQTFWQYIGGEKGIYSPDAADRIKHMPKAMAGMSSTESDAISQWIALVQLAALNPLDDVSHDKTLNGPTTNAWFKHWKLYLKKKGVRFFRGRISDIRLVGDEFVPVVEGPTENDDLPVAEEPEHQFIPTMFEGDVELGTVHDFFLLAVPLETASELVWKAHKQARQNDIRFRGPFRQLMEFDVRAGWRKEDGTLLELGRDPGTGRRNPSDRMRDINGVQYFFYQKQYRIGEGHAYFPDSPWAITAISQYPYWKDRTSPVGKFIGQVSADIGDWYTSEASVQTGKFGSSAWRSTGRRTALETWHQILDGHETSHRERIAMPDFYHLDWNLVFVEYRSSGFHGNCVYELKHAVRDPTSELNALVKYIEQVDGSSDKTELFDYFVIDGLLVVSPKIYAKRVIARIDVNIRDGEIDNSIYDDLYISIEGDLGRKIVEVVKNKNNTWGIRKQHSRKSTSKHIEKIHGYISKVNEYQLRITLDIILKETKSVSAGSLSNRINIVAAFDEDDRPLIGSRHWAKVKNPAKQYLRECRRPAFGIDLESKALFRSSIVARVTGEHDAGMFGLAVGMETQPASGFSMIIEFPASVEEIRNEIFDGLSGLYGDTASIEKVDDDGLLISPKIEADDVTIAINHVPDSPIKLMIGTASIEIKGISDLTKTELRDLCCAEIEKHLNATRSGSAFRLKKVGMNRLRLSLAPRRQAGQSRNNRFSVCVSNADGAIELCDCEPIMVSLLNLEFANPENALPLRNSSPYLINVPGQWRYRPGLHETRKERPRPRSPHVPEQQNIWYGHSDCPSLRRWIAAGNYAATYTQLTTMESANESARHAVNAILHMIMTQQSEKGEDVYNSGGILLGDFCEIHDPQKHEIADFDHFKELDDELLRRGLPHILDLFEIIEMADNLEDYSDAHKISSKLHSVSASYPGFGSANLHQEYQKFSSGLVGYLLNMLNAHGQRSR